MQGAKGVASVLALEPKETEADEGETFGRTEKRAGSKFQSNHVSLSRLRSLHGTPPGGLKIADDEVRPFKTDGAVAIGLRGRFYSGHLRSRGERQKPENRGAFPRAARATGSDTGPYQSFSRFADHRTQQKLLTH
jgi:hypothetical protein